MEMKRYNISFNEDKDKEIIKKLDEQENKTDYIRDLVCKDLGIERDSPEFREACGKYIARVEEQIRCCYFLMDKDTGNQLSPQTKKILYLRTKYPTLLNQGLAEIYEKEYGAKMTKARISYALNKIVALATNYGVKK